MMLQKKYNAVAPCRINFIILKLTILIARLLFLPFFRITVSGVENIPYNNAFILLPKHQRWTDIPLIAMSVESSYRLYYIAKHELFSNPLKNWFISSLGGLPLNREKPIESRHTFSNLLSVLHNGEGLVVFPEGTYFPDIVGPGNIGIIRLIAAKMDLPFLPVGIQYKKKKFLTYITVKFGKPVFFNPENYRKPGKENIRQFVDIIMTEIADLSDLPCCHAGHQTFKNLL